MAGAAWRGYAPMGGESRQSAYRGTRENPRRTRRNPSPASKARVSERARTERLRSDLLVGDVRVFEGAGGEPNARALQRDSAPFTLRRGERQPSTRPISAESVALTPKCAECDAGVHVRGDQGSHGRLDAGQSTLKACPRLRASSRASEIFFQPASWRHSRRLVTPWKRQAGPPESLPRLALSNAVESPPILGLVHSVADRGGPTSIGQQSVHDDGVKLAAAVG
jgi:hypothetical protein